MKIESVEISTLSFDPSNARKHSEKNLKAIKGSIAKFGQQKPIVVGKDNVIIAGNGFAEAAKDLGWKKIDIVRTKLKGAEAIAYGLADNRTTDLSEWDDDVLGKLLQGLYEDDFDIEEIGFDLDSIDTKESSEGLTDDDEIPEVEENIHGVKLGEIYQLGDHRLMCGDSTCKETVDKLMGGEKADMVFTDPPYGIDRSGQKERFVKNSKHKRKSHVDKGWDAERPGKELFEYIFSLDIPTALFGGNYFCDMIKPTMGWIYWDKGQNGLSMSDGELCATNQQKALRSIVCNRANIGKSVHPTQKPVEVVEFCLNYLGDGKKVLDLFLGSGSTLIACEKTARKCYGMEIDPHYCSVIIERWQQFTGKTAVKITGK